MKTKTAWSKYTPAQQKNLEKLAAAYRDFLDNGKTERECVSQIVDRIEKEGYVELSDAIKTGKKLKAGDKVYAVNMEKSVIMFQRVKNRWKAV